MRLQDEIFQKIHKKTHVLESHFYRVAGWKIFLKLKENICYVLVFNKVASWNILLNLEENTCAGVPFLVKLQVEIFRKIYRKTPLSKSRFNKALGLELEQVLFYIKFCLLETPQISLIISAISLQWKYFFSYFKASITQISIDFTTLESLLS